MTEVLITRSSQPLRQLRTASHRAAPPVLRLPAFVLMFLAATTRAQTPPTLVGDDQPQRLELHVSTTLVALDVIVTDKHGDPVRNLTRDDFTVYENGEEQTLRRFDAPSASAPAVQMVLPVQDRNGVNNWGDTPLTAIVLDELNGSFEEVGYSRLQLQRFLRSQPPLLASPVSLFFVSDSGFGALCPYTRDRDAVAAALSRHITSQSSALARGDSDEQLGRSLTILRQIALSGAGVKSRKVLIWMGAGFPGMNPKDLLPDAFDRLQKMIRGTVNLLQDSHVTLYRLDPTSNGTATTGLSDPGRDSSQMLAEVQDPFAVNFNFNEFVVQTGGKYEFDPDEINRPIAAAMNESTDAYTLAYSPSDRDPSHSYRSIVVRTKDPSFRVTTRRGYYFGSHAMGTPSRKELGFDLFEAGVTNMIYTGLGVHIQSCTAPSAGSVACTLNVDTGSLTFSDSLMGGEEATLISVGISLDPKRRVLQKSVEQSTLRIPAAEVPKIATSRSLLSVNAGLPKGTGSIRFVVRDEGGRIGTTEIAVDQLNLSRETAPAEHR